LKKLIKPEKIKIEKETFSNVYGKFVIEPLEKGWGITIGNALRRILLSSIPGAAITSVKIEGVPHEFFAIPGVREDMLEIIQNLKQVRVKLFAEEKKISLDFKGPLKIKASHFQVDSDLEIINPDLYITTLSNENTQTSMELTFAQGKGYAEAKENKKADQPLGIIPIDSIFTPIKKVKYEVKPFRIGGRTDFDSLILEIFTDGTIKPDEALKKASELSKEYLEIFISTISTEEKERGREKAGNFLKQKIEKLGLSRAPLNALKNSGIEKIEDLLKKDSDGLLKIEKFGKKSLQKVEEKLDKYNLKLTPKRGNNETQKKGNEIRV